MIARFKPNLLRRQKMQSWTRKKSSSKTSIWICLPNMDISMDKITRNISKSQLTILSVFKPEQTIRRPDLTTWKLTLGFQCPTTLSQKCILFQPIQQTIKNYSNFLLSSVPNAYFPIPQCKYRIVSFEFSALFLASLF